MTEEQRQTIIKTAEQKFQEGMQNLQGPRQYVVTENMAFLYGLHFMAELLLEQTLEGITRYYANTLAAEAIYAGIIVPD